LLGCTGLTMNPAPESIVYTKGNFAQHIKEHPNPLFLSI
jgi:hypothetical protein